VLKIGVDTDQLRARTKVPGETKLLRFESANVSPGGQRTPPESGFRVPAASYLILFETLSPKVHVP
jgi:hypothetical protein